MKTYTYTNQSVALIITYSFDGDVAVYIHPNIESAKKELKAFYEEELRIQREENEWDPIGKIEEDGLYATITTHSDAFDEEDVIEYRIGNIYN